MDEQTPTSGPPIPNQNTNFNPVVGPDTSLDGQSPKANQNPPKWKMVLGVAAILIIGLVAGFFVGRLESLSGEPNNPTLDQVGVKPEEDKTSTETPSETPSDNSESTYVLTDDDKREIKETIKKFSLGTIPLYPGLAATLNIDDDYKHILTQNFKSIVGNLTDNQKVSKAIASLRSADGCEAIHQGDTLSEKYMTRCKKDDVAQEFYSIFGKEMLDPSLLSVEEIKPSCMGWEIDSETGDFYELNGGCGGVSASGEIVDILSYDVKGEQIYINTILSTIKFTDDSFGEELVDIYPNIYNELTNSTPIYESINASEVINTIDANLNQFAHYTIIFNIVQDEVRNIVIAFDKVLEE